MAQVAGVGAADLANGIAMDATAALAQIRRARHASSGRTPDDTWRGMARRTACNAARGVAAQARCVSMLRGHAVLAGLTQNIHKTNEGRPATVRLSSRAHSRRPVS
jgi:hypothetical protein